ncbi:hypothetical protein VTL71DRAFT_3383 [Oculimacula yallundae]|uniref:Uncharacterized protein n=1 Tax=Oculimacula yallundae TaxID=86028 RepID=A0ABR4C715_9HELO
MIWFLQSSLFPALVENSRKGRVPRDGVSRSAAPFKKLYVEKRRLRNRSEDSKRSLHAQNAIAHLTRIISRRVLPWRTEKNWYKVCMRANEVRGMQSGQTKEKWCITAEINRLASVSW